MYKANHNSNFPPAKILKKEKKTHMFRTLYTGLKMWEYVSTGIVIEDKHDIRRYVPVNGDWGSFRQGHSWKCRIYYSCTIETKITPLHHGQCGIKKRLKVLHNFEYNESYILYSCLMCSIIWLL